MLNLEKRREGRRRYYRNHRDSELAANRRWKEENAATVKGYILAQKERIAGRPRPDICELCGEKPKKMDKRHGIQFDHCHKTGKFRGWLCYRCNVVIGRVCDSPELLRKLANYLDAFNSAHL